MLHKEDMASVVFFVAVVILMVAVGFHWKGRQHGRQEIRIQAVEAGHADWVVSGSKGETEFKWKP